MFLIKFDFIILKLLIITLVTGKLFIIPGKILPIHDGNFYFRKVPVGTRRDCVEICKSENFTLASAINTENGLECVIPGQKFPIRDLVPSSTLRDISIVINEDGYELHGTRLYRASKGGQQGEHDEYVGNAWLRCKEKGAQLLTLESDEIFEHVKGFLNYHGDTEKSYALSYFMAIAASDTTYGLEASDESGWKFINGTFVDGSFILPAGPDNVVKVCSQLRWVGDSRWKFDYARCDKPKRYICQLDF